MILQRNFNSFVFVVAIQLCCVISLSLGTQTYGQTRISQAKFETTQLPSLPDPLGVAGPFAGITNDALVVAGGANFPAPVWENDKVWHDRIHVLTRSESAENDVNYQWVDGGKLPHSLAYGATVSTKLGIVCMGGNDGQKTYDDVFVLSWDAAKQQVTQRSLPSLPTPCAHGAATIIGDIIYMAGGQSDNELQSAQNQLWALDLSQLNGKAELQWEVLPPIPGPPRAFNLTVAQHNGYDNCVYVISGRRKSGPGDRDVEFLTDVWEYCPTTKQWRQRQDAPRCFMAGTGIDVGQSHIMVLGGADGGLFFRGNELKDNHPGFPKATWLYHSITDTWIQSSDLPANHVTTNAVRWHDSIIIPSGEIRPRVRSPEILSIRLLRPSTSFGTLNYLVLIVYLAAIVAIGIYFASRNKSTDDYFRGGKHIPWWAAGCSIFATMLSSLTYTGIPSKAYAQDWAYSVGNLMIPVVAIVAVYIALPFFRRLDVTSAYQYLEKRFDRKVRMFGSGSFILFHIFRMAVVMSLTGLALAVATPLSPQHAVLIMGVLSIVYCTLGGIEAVIWTDTVQTFVLLGGALLAIILLIAGVDGGITGLLDVGSEAGKFSMAHFHWAPDSTRTAFWIIVIGSIAQNLSSYTADQAVVQRYMTTSNQAMAARSIWTNAIMSIPATFLFFGIGSALFAYYHSNPGRLEPTITTDQVFPLFIAREMPAGVAGLIVAGIFAAAQSTVSTSMNSTATAIVTDFMRPFQWLSSDRSYLNAARFLTLLLGITSTGLAFVFIDPQIKSLFDTFIVVIGMFMGMLGGLFILGTVSRRANASGALAGAIGGAITMIVLWRYTSVNGYLYSAAGVFFCVTIGWIASFVSKPPSKDLTGLTLHSLWK